jgi:hypothetical protein
MALAMVSVSFWALLILASSRWRKTMGLMAAAKTATMATAITISIRVNPLRVLSFRTLIAVNPFLVGISSPVSQEVGRLRFTSREPPLQGYDRKTGSGLEEKKTWELRKKTGGNHP